MKIKVYSDIHLEFKDYIPSVDDADVIVLAGDIYTKGRGIAWATKHFSKPVIFVAGNHDYWGGNVDLSLRSMKEAARQTSNIHLLENTSTIIDGVRFFGATLWTDFNLDGRRLEAMYKARQDMHDYKKIRHGEGYHRFVPEKALRLHEQSVLALKEFLATPFEGKTVVVTHHAPSVLSLINEVEGDISNACYASNLDYLMGDNIALWIHGHIHSSLDYMRNGTRVVCNPRGYLPKWPNPDFDENLIVLPN